MAAWPPDQDGPSALRAWPAAGRAGARLRATRRGPRPAGHVVRLCLTNRADPNHTAAPQRLRQVEVRSRKRGTSFSSTATSWGSRPPKERSG